MAEHYNNFIAENKITTNEVKIINVPQVTSKVIIKFKTEFNEYFKNNQNNDN